MAGRLGILAGRGPLPAQVAAVALAQGRDVFVLAFENETDPALVRDLPHRWLPVGAVARTIEALRAAAVDEVVLIGPVRRPSLTSLDRRGVQLLARLGFGRQGDDRLLRLVVEELEREGFRVVGADALVADLLAPEGPMTRALPDQEAQRDIALGIETALRLGDRDAGQAAIVQAGRVLGVEDREGTDALIARCAAQSRAGRGGVLVKVKKPCQERRADLPAIGPQTVRLAAGAGIAGIAVQAGECLIIERAEAIAEADRAGLFVIGVGR